MNFLVQGSQAAMWHDKHGYDKELSVSLPDLREGAGHAHLARCMTGARGTCPSVPPSDSLSPHEERTRVQHEGSDTRGGNRASLPSGGRRGPWTGSVRRRRRPCDRRAGAPLRVGGYFRRSKLGAEFYSAEYFAECFGRIGFAAHDGPMLSRVAETAKAAQARGSWAC